MKKPAKALSVLTASSMMAFFMGMMEITAAETNPNISVVIGMKDDTVMLSNGCVLSQKAFQEYSGEEFLLAYGDVVSVMDATIEPIELGYYALYEQSEIAYLGTAAEYYADSTKCLTVTDVMASGEKVVFEDADGTVYQWLTNSGRIAYYGFTSEIDPYTFEVGNAVDCAVKTVEYYVGDALCFREDVVLPLTGIETMQNVQQKPAAERGDVVYGDVNGSTAVDILDVILLNKHLLGEYPLSESQKSACDVNLDGKIDPMDSLNVMKHIVGITFALGKE